MDSKINELHMSDLKIGAFVCVLVGYVFLILPENMYSDFRRIFCPESSQDLVETNSLTRRYKYSTPASPIPASNANAIISNINVHNSNANTTNIQNCKINSFSNNVTNR